MSSCRRKIWIAALLALALCAFASAIASANPLLSGYGGPGQGDQAILGATLLNGPSSGGGSSSGEAAAGTAAALTATEGRASRSGAGGHRETGRRSSRRSHTAAPAKKAAPASTGAVPATATLPAGEVSSSDVLGLSGIDFLYILLAFGALALTGGLTRQLVRRAP